MKARLFTSIALVAFAVPALFAGSLDKYKNWANSPQGYFMTAAERADWKANVKTDADAEAFVKKFLAARAPGFAEDVAARAAVADKRLTVSGRAGSLTMRGKIVILLGPPSSFSVEEREMKGNASDNGQAYANMSNGSSPSGADVSAMGMAADRRAMSSDLWRNYTFTYAADRLPVKQSKDLVVMVQVRAGDGSDRIVDRKAASQLDEIFEAAAQKSIVASAAKP